MNRIVPRLAFLLLAPLMIVGCSETVGPDFDYPISFSAKSVLNKSEISVYVRDGNSWKKVDAAGTTVAENDFFDDLDDVDPEANFTLLSETTFSYDALPTATFKYSVDGDDFTFDTPFGDEKQYGRYESDAILMRTGVVVTVEVDGPTRIEFGMTISPKEGEDIPAKYGTDEAVDTLAFMTADIRFEEAD